MTWRITPATAASSRWPVVAITLLALALRLFRLDAQSLWVDEVVTWRLSQLPLTELSRGFYTLSHSLYYAIIHGVLGAHDGEIALRLPSVVFGVVSVPLLYDLGRDWLGRRVGLAAATLLAVSPLHVYYSQEARPYAALLFFALLTLVCLARAAAGTGGSAWRVGFVAAYAAALFCHPVAVAFVPVIALAALAALPDLRRWTGTLIVLAAVTAAALAIPVMLSPVASDPAPPASPYAFVYTAWVFATGFSLGPSVRELHAPDRLRIAFAYAPLVTPILVVFGGLALAGGARAWKEAPKTTTLLLAWVLLPVAFVFLGSRSTGLPYNVRYAILALPPFALLVAIGIGALPGGRPWRAVAWTLVLLVSAISLRNYYFDPRYEREDYRSAVKALRAGARPGDLVIVSVPYTRDVLRYYDPGPVEVVTFPRPARERDASVRRQGTWQDELDRLTAGRERFWVLLSRTFHGSVGDRFLPYLDRRFRRGLDEAWPGTRLIRYEVSRQGAEPAVR